MPRPRKLTRHFIDTLTRVLNEQHNCLICTDEELLLLVNVELPPRYQIAARTFRRYKAKSLLPDEQHLDKLFTAFSHTIMLCRIKEKQNLFTRLSEDPRNWTKWKWMIERKFTDWTDKQPDNQSMQPLLLNIYPHKLKNDR